MTSPDPSRRVVMGMIYGMDPASLRVFFESLRRCGYRGRIVMFVAAISPEVEAFLRSYGVELVSCDGMGVTRTNLARKRFTFYLRWLEQQTAPIDRILMSDVRDVCFQAEPFEGVRNDDVQYYCEAASKRIIDDKINAKWAKLYWPRSAPEAARLGPIICAGVIIAGRQAGLNYLRALVRRLDRLPFWQKNQFGPDQSFHQYIALVSKEAPGPIVPNNEHVATMGMEPENLYAWNEGVTLAEGRLMPVLHQYDRHEGFRALIEARYGAGPAPDG